MSGESIAEKIYIISTINEKSRQMKTGCFSAVGFQRKEGFLRIPSGWLTCSNISVKFINKNKIEEW